jgi:hypothetical protein
MGHTPGPWKYEVSTKTIRSIRNYWLATMDSFEGAVDHEANARLIAAAPDLLEQLKAAVDLLGTMQINATIAPESLDAVMHHLRQYKAVIKRAEAIDKAKEREHEISGNQS